MQTDGAFQVAADAWEEAGDPKKASLMVSLQPSVIAAREREYREDEQRRLNAELRRLERDWRTTSRQDRQVAIADAIQYLERDPEIFEERVRWLLDGTFGAGAMYRAREIGLASRRQNRAAQLFQLVMALDDRLPQDPITRVWRSITPQAQRNVTRILEAGLREAELEARRAAGLGT